MRLYGPAQFRFHPADQGQYGSEWYTYDEASLVRVPARKLMEIESAIGMSIVDMIERMQANRVDGILAATWTARHLAGVEEDFATYEPLILLMEWEWGQGASDADPPSGERSESPGTE